MTIIDADYLSNIGITTNDFEECATIDNYCANTVNVSMYYNEYGIECCTYCNRYLHVDAIQAYIGDSVPYMEEPCHAEPGGFCSCQWCEQEVQALSRSTGLS